MAQRLRDETTIPLVWIAERLQMDPDQQPKTHNHQPRPLPRAFAKRLGVRAVFCRFPVISRSTHNPKTHNPP
jgi:hypothetical protein